MARTEQNEETWDTKRDTKRGASEGSEGSEGSVEFSNVFNWNMLEQLEQSTSFNLVWRTLSGEGESWDDQGARRGDLCIDIHVFLPRKELAIPLSMAWKAPHNQATVTPRSWYAADDREWKSTFNRQPQPVSICIFCCVCCYTAILLYCYIALQLLQLNATLSHRLRCWAQISEATPLENEMRRQGFGGSRETKKHMEKQNHSDTPPIRSDNIT